MSFVGNTGDKLNNGLIFSRLWDERGFSNFHWANCLENDSRRGARRRDLDRNERK